MLEPQLAAALDAAFPGRTPGPKGIAQLADDYAANGGAEKIGDLDDWVRRRRHCVHPAYEIEQDQLKRRFLPGQTKHGVGAAEIETGRGPDGLWYARHGYSLGDGGGATPITHSPAHATEADAIAWAAREILDRVVGRGGSEAARRWATKIETWCREQVGGQQELAL